MYQASELTRYHGFGELQERAEGPDAAEDI